VKLAYVADGRSPIALQWMKHFVEAGHEVHLLSTFPCRPDLRLASVQIIPVAFSGVRGRRADGAPAVGSESARPAAGLFGAGGIPLRAAVRHWLGPLTVPAAARRLRHALAQIQPDLVHALRVPFEGMLAAAADPSAPLLLSVWGNDFTLHAPSAPGMRRLTRRALARADGLHCDCHRDLRLAERWGLRPSVPGAVIPGNGGVRTEIFYPADGGASAEKDSPAGHQPPVGHYGPAGHPPPVGHLDPSGPLSPAGHHDPAAPHAPAGPPSPALSQPPPGWERLPDSDPLIVNPRGFRGYVRNDTFFRAIPLVLQRQPKAFFACPAMAGARPAQDWVARLGIRERVALLPGLNPEHLAALFRRSQVSASPSRHDGTPNTLLEAMACGCFPLAGDLESIREWIEPGVNGLLFDPADPRSLAEAILRALADEGLRAAAAQANRRLIAERGTYALGMARAEELYGRLTGV
jgi:glycosyltransferase involved in cell wall biosynthesis